jgi:hypothetical protein
MAINFPAKTIGQNIGDNHIDPITNLEWIWDGYSWNSVSAVSGSTSLDFNSILDKPTTLLGYGITDAQALDADLTAIAGLTTTGLIKRTGNGTASIIIDNSANWDTSYSWGNHATAGYLLSGNITESDIPTLSQSKITNLTTDLAAKAVVNYSTATIPSADSWSGSSAPFTHTLSLAGITSTDRPVVDLDTSGLAYADVAARSAAWAKVYRVDSGTGTLTFYADEKPAVTLPILVGVTK